MWAVFREPTNDFGFRHVGEFGDRSLKPGLVKTPKNCRNGVHQEALSIAPTGRDDCIE
jgi:hypothetical protein